MKHFIGKAHNINEDILGVITKSRLRLFNRHKYIYVSETIKDNVCGFSATITNQSLLKPKGLIVSDINQSIDEFCEGDVVLINKSGEIIFLYEIQSHSNAIFATERCNHRCIMCPQPPVLKEINKTPFNLKLISLINRKTAEIGITGGEPTMIGDDLFVLIKAIQRHQPEASISILSNGVKFSDKNYAKKIAECHHHDLQIDIPLFSDIAQIHNEIVGARTFYKTVQGLYNLALFHVKIGIRIVVHKETYMRLPQFADFIYHNFPFVSQVAFMQMETIGLAEENIEKLWIDPYEYNTELREAVLLLADKGITPYIYNSQLCILPEDIRCYAQQSISEWKDIYIPECDGCLLKGKCPGFFESNRNYHSRMISPFRE